MVDGYGALRGGGRGIGARPGLRPAFEPDQRQSGRGVLLRPPIRPSARADPKTVELDPSFIAAQALHAVLLARAGYFDHAVAEAQKCFSLPGYELRARTTLGMVYAIAGRAEEAMKIAGELENQPQLLRLDLRTSNIMDPWRLRSGAELVARGLSRACTTLLYSPGTQARKPARRSSL